MSRLADYLSDAVLALCLLLACAVGVVAELEECRSCAAAIGSPAPAEVPLLKPSGG